MRLCETSGGRPAAVSCALENEMAKVAVQFTDTMDHYLLCRPQATSGQVLKPKASNGTSPIFFLRTYSSGFRLQSSTSQPWLPEELRVGIRDGAEVGRAPYLALPSPPPLLATPKDEIFWLSYGAQQGFDVRKRYSNKRKFDRMIRSCRFVCANEGHRLKDKMNHLIKCLRAETRTDCQVHMGLILDREKRNYKVTKLILEHNHTLQLPQT
jgi:hypothetical protein